MKRTSAPLLSLLSLAIGFGVATTSRDAHALGPIGVEVGAKAGVGTNPSGGTINPLGFGLGARGGVTILGLYGGINVMYYLGGSDSGVSRHTLLYGIEGGYGFELGPLTIRPQLGLGNSSFTTSGTLLGVNFDASKSYLYLEPGVTGLVSLGGLFVGADANVLIIPGVETSTGIGQTSSETYTSFTLHGQAGFKF